jgi:hypothetical protein
MQSDFLKQVAGNLSTEPRGAIAMLTDQLMFDRDLMIRLEQLYFRFYGPVPVPPESTLKAASKPDGEYWRIKSNCEDQDAIRERVTICLSQLETLL